MRPTSSCLIPLAIALISAVGCSRPEHIASQADVSKPSRDLSAVKMPEDFKQESLRDGVSAALAAKQTTSRAEEQRFDNGRASDEPENDRASIPKAERDHVHDRPIAADVEQNNKAQQDGDDENAPIIIPEKEEQEETALNNGREPTSTPLPEEQRIATASAETEITSLDNGRNPAATPGGQTLPKQDNVPAPTKTAKKSSERTRKSLEDLPQSIQSLDKDADGQIGLYEWPRETLNQFTELDTNDDGFLTPKELLTAQRKALTAKKSRQPSAGKKGPKPTKVKSSESARPGKATTSEKESES